LPSGAHYDNPSISATAALFARLGVHHVDWVGTSLGGYIGMQMAALPHNPIRRLVLNDFGARVGHAALRRIATYLREAPKLRDIDSAEAYLREVLAPFGALTDAQWRHIAQHSLAKDAKGALRWHYDPAIASNFSLLIAFDVVLWHLWEEISPGPDRAARTRSACPAHDARMLAARARRRRARSPQPNGPVAVMRRR
jgi:pimeloyl-ACP methyl ester carboxylesterase